MFMDRDRVKVYKHAKEELGQYPTIVTEQDWSITHIYPTIGLCVLGRRRSKSIFEALACSKPKTSVSFVLFVKTIVTLKEN